MSLVQAKVLIIDTNFRRNALTKALLPRMDSRRLLKKGIDDDDDDDLMLEENNFDENDDESCIWSSRSPAKTNPGEKDLTRILINRTKFPGVDIIGNIGANDSPSEIMAGPRFQTNDSKFVIAIRLCHYGRPCPK